MFCRNCGNEMNDEDAFCQKCGSKNGDIAPAKPSGLVLVSKIFLIISLVGMVLFFVAGIVLACSTQDYIPKEGGEVIKKAELIKAGVAIMIYCGIAIFITIFSIYKLNTVTEKNGIIIWGILALLFSGILAGIFMLLTTDADYAHNKAKNNPQLPINSDGTINS